MAQLHQASDRRDAPMGRTPPGGNAQVVRQVRQRQFLTGIGFSLQGRVRLEKEGNGSDLYY